MRTLAPRATFTSCVPFALEPLKKRFPEIEWLVYDDAARARTIAACDAWLGLGGSPFQSAQSRWFVDHLVAEEKLCAAAKKPMFFLGVGVQTAAELHVPDVHRLVARAEGIWTRDPASAKFLSAIETRHPVEAGADLAHVFFRDEPPPAAASGQLTLVANFDYGTWRGQPAFLRAAKNFPATERVWLAQETRALPGAERALHDALAPDEQKRWRLVVPDEPGAPLARALARWPSGEWLVTARFHAALAGAWARSKIVVISTNEKLRAVARELGAPLLSPEADEAAVARALESAPRATPSAAQAERAYAACAAFVRAAT
jgi:hypothetical protein